MTKLGSEDFGGLQWQGKISDNFMQPESVACENGMKDRIHSIVSAFNQH